MAPKINYKSLLRYTVMGWESKWPKWQMGGGIIASTDIMRWSEKKKEHGVIKEKKGSNYTTLWKKSRTTRNKCVKFQSKSKEKLWKKNVIHKCKD